MALNYYKNELKENAQLLASKGKGILAVDESTKTVGKRLAGIGVENTEDNRKAYRGMLFTTCLLYTSPSPRDESTSRMPSSA